MFKKSSKMQNNSNTAMKKHINASWENDEILVCFYRDGVYKGQS